ncbi:MAG: adenine phosphoribosyltransferase [Prosthecochloris sp.]|uniref:Adenine phosphoribosyltransferase n=1 Tax=Prosthecochloris aestuarii (strain DSM 271 / SK 413) TaxID=290512 RepID=APT_PROA2|nr:MULTISPECIES: adenine phosphoribosyltransferase [Prosthecochloris]B4S410.1 RecName: Full=Adenine phosphoribosyltransferase; Short=APRT [Prosthecochloris aestuarii DSM 271]ACF46802.1 adenine phosphoribosyltransferase [Prosthecochloris aestuarii DSM 271]MCW8797927.1 adenine phosphoribosyltransferase [Prosthecochloris sp.]
MPIKSRIRTIPDYPKKGIMFRDITTLLKDPVGFRLVIDQITQHYLENGINFDMIIGMEARGFIIGGALSYTLGKGFVPIRKPGKLPGETVNQEYQLEYGTDKVEMHIDALEKGTRVLLVDDLLATGGTALAGAALIEKVGGVVADMAFIVNLPDIGGQKKLEEKGYSLFSLTEFEGD